MSDYANITIEKKHPAATITFTRPDVLNALNTQTLNEILQALQALRSDPDVPVIIITGTGKAFVAGADISEIRGFTPDDARKYSQLGHTIMDTIQEMEKPVIAAINGYALGGGTELALSCDVRIASDKAKFGLPEAALGVIPGWGATQRAARLIGTALAKELIFTADMITAQRALDIGLVNHVVPGEHLMKETLEMAEKISIQGQIALAHAKKVINEGVHLPLHDGCKLEIEAFVSCFETEDQKEGMKAFMEKRKPRFQGK